MRPNEKRAKAISEAAIAKKSRHDISEMPETTILSIRAAQSAADELGHLMDVLKERRSAICDDVYDMVGEFISKQHGVTLSRDDHIGMQIDWHDKVIDVLTKEVIEDALHRNIRSTIDDAFKKKETKE